MKFVILCSCVLILFLTFVETSTDCKCWEDFEAEKSESGAYYCRGKKHFRIFGCNEKKPPLCKCTVNGKTQTLDLGETNCLGVSQTNGRWCDNREEWNEYFRKHPEHAIYDK